MIDFCHFVKKFSKCDRLLLCRKTKTNLHEWQMLRDFNLHFDDGCILRCLTHVFKLITICSLLSFLKSIVIKSLFYCVTFSFNNGIIMNICFVLHWPLKEFSLVINSFSFFKALFGKVVLFLENMSSCKMEMSGWRDFGKGLY